MGAGCRRRHRGTGPQGTDHGLDEAVIVLDQDRHVVALANAARHLAVGDPVGALFQLAIGDARGAILTGIAVKTRAMCALKIPAGAPTGTSVFGAAGRTPPQVG